MHRKQIIDPPSVLMSQANSSLEMVSLTPKQRRAKRKAIRKKENRRARLEMQASDHSANLPSTGDQFNGCVVISLPGIVRETLITDEDAYGTRTLDIEAPPDSVVFVSGSWDEWSSRLVCRRDIVFGDLALFTSTVRLLRGKYAVGRWRPYQKDWTTVCFGKRATVAIGD